MPRSPRSPRDRPKSRPQPASPGGRRDRRVAALAAGSEGVLEGGELRSCGLDRHAIELRSRNGRLHRTHHNVYAVGHPNLSLTGRFIAAYKACDGHAALSHRAMAAHTEIRSWTGGDIELTALDGLDHDHDGIKVHRSAYITRADCMIRDGILMTKPTWTVVALAAVLSHQDLRAATRTALGRQLTSVRSILELLDRLGPVRGSRVMRVILARGLPTRSELEDVMLGVILAGGFAMPDVNKPLYLEGRKVVPDFRWPEQRLVLEADGARWHDDALARADDAERQALLEAYGETVLRGRWDQATLRPREVHNLLAEAGAPAP